MHNEDTDDIVADAADAVTLNQDVQWERCARLAAPASRGVLDNLRTLSRAFATGHGSGHAAVNPALSDSEPYAGPFVRRILKALVAIAAVEVAAALALVAWPWSDFHPQQNDFGVYLTTLLVGHASTAGLLLLAGRRDRQTWLLGGYFLLKATLAPLPMLYAFLWGMLTPDMSRVISGSCPRRAGFWDTCMFTLTCTRRRSCGRSPESVPTSIAGPGWMTLHGAWSPSAWESVSASGSCTRCRWSSCGQAMGPLPSA